jgi:ferritin-like metal-binding protein YciE
LQEEMKDIYDFEKRLVRALPKMAKGASAPALRSAIEEHLEATKGQVTRVEQVFEALGVAAKAKPCAGMKGLLEEGEEVLAQDATPALKDVAIIGAAQRVEHYEMAAYGTARALAEKLGLQDVVDLLQETLDEEKEADETLTEIASEILGSVEATGQETSGRKLRTSGA